MDKLTELENDNIELLEQVKSKSERENSAMALPELEISEPKPRVLSMRVPSWVAAAAMVCGIAIGIALPRHKATGTDMRSSFNYADTCRSIAQDDVNLALLVTSL